MSYARAYLLIVFAKCSMASFIPQRQLCTSSDLCADHVTISCQEQSVILVQYIASDSRDHTSCDVIGKLREQCNYKTTCRIKKLRRCCTKVVASLTVAYACINDSAIDALCHQSPKEPISSNTRHIYPLINQSLVTSGPIETKSKPPFCQWKIPIPVNRSVEFKIHQLSKPSGNCRGTSSLLVQYDVAERKRPKYARDVPTCVKSGGGHMFTLERASPHVLVWFTPTDYREKLWLSFELITDPKQDGPYYVTPNATGCIATVPELPTAISPLNHDDSTVTSPESVVDTETKDTWSIERMALIAALAAVATIAVFFLVVSVILFCKLHRLRFLSKGFSRLRKMPGSGFDQVSRRQQSEKSDHLVDGRPPGYDATQGDYRNCDTAIYAVAMPRATNTEENFLRNLELSTPIVQYENLRNEPHNSTRISGENCKERPTKPSRVHMALTDDMFQGTRRPSNEYSSRDWIVPQHGDDFIDITKGHDTPAPGHYRQASTVENSLYDSPNEDDEDTF